MERFSNDIHELRAAAEAEVSLVEVKKDEKVIVLFAEFPSIKGFPFAIVLLENAQGEIRSSFRQGDTQYDCKRWKNGIYNLDRLRITTNEYLFSSSETEEVHSIIADIRTKNIPKSLRNTEVVVLDGSEWRLKIETSSIEVDFSWEAATDDIEIFVPLIELLEQLCSIRPNKG